ncbi:MAG: Gfo/Idh/MocA family oxidoreductase [Firmicutes bacterium]|nr:Gfo/Idh/MocA family oxidoreductase [Bacillota bacterium]
MRLRTIIVGCGWAGNQHAQMIKKHGRAQIAAVVDSDRQSAEALGAKLGVPALRSVEEALSTVDFTAANVCTPTETHFSICKHLIEAGKHILCEKPLTLHMDQGYALAGLARKHQVDIKVNFNQRYASPIQRLKELIDGDGPIHMVKIAMYQHPPQVDSATAKSFLITDACCHLIDTILFLNGDIEEVHAYGNMLDSDILSSVTVNLRFANNSVGTLSNTFVGGLLDSQHPFQDLEVVTGQTRYVVDNLYDGLFIYPHDDLYQKKWLPSVFQPRSYEASMQASIGAWIDAVLDGSGVAPGVEEAVKNLEVVHGIMRSLETESAVKLGLEQP